MPLILMCGFPCSGKSSRAEEVAKRLGETYGIAAHLIGEESCSAGDGSFQRNQAFNNEGKEKQLRAHIRSDVQRKLSQEHDVVIVDSPNYIKGYRYELYCLSKSNRSTFCVLQCETSVDVARRWNEQRPAEQQYTKDTFEALVTRFEVPDSRNRWDSPLFSLQPDDELPLGNIYSCLFEKKPPPANQSTQSQPLMDTNFLYNLDKITQEIVYSILEAQKTCVLGEEIVVPNASVRLRLTRKLTASELTRLRRQFTTYSKMHPVDDCQKCYNMFVTYISSGSLQ